MSTNCIECVVNERTGIDLLCDTCRKPRVGNLSEAVPCEFIASVIQNPLPVGEGHYESSIPFLVEGRFLIHDGLAVVLHQGYGAEKGSPLVFVSEYTTGCFILKGKRSEVLELLSRKISDWVENLGTILEVRSMFNRFRGIAAPRNTALTPRDYLLS